MGKIVLPGGGVFVVEDTQTYTGYTVHIGELKGDAKVRPSDRDREKEAKNVLWKMKFANSI